ncbi:hypothetical protein [Muricoccus pecuniae]|uniref:F0F1-type ATP synthase membrane subunit b/b n=1 Tax=Muricoccus pecuniae TaxID=693023 RepID=A0A840Y574_9PROT|nr:hypothetical protein [Roseomonas pecuniae]MBB5695296.1 F0F1-type ATP synthase membrane subunit b/b' [Roseomonas pecuniae]
MSDRPETIPPSTEPLTAMREDAQAAASRIQAGAGEAAGQVRETLASAADEASTRTEELVDAARERAEGLAEEGKAAAAERASGFATAIRHAADDLEGSSPEIARHVRVAADSVEGISSALRDRSAGQLVQDVTDFARRQPAAFFGVAALAGFALARFARSSSEGTTSGHSSGMSTRTSTGMSGGHPMGHPAPATPATAPGWSPSGGHSARPMTMAAASLGGAAAHRPGEATPGSMPVGATGEVTARPAGAAAMPATGGGISSPMPNERSETPL